MLAVVPATLTSPLKANYYYDLSSTQSTTDQNLFIVHLPKIFSASSSKPPIYSHQYQPWPYHPAKRQTHGQINPLNHNYTAAQTASVNKITHVVRPNIINAN